MNGTTTTTNFTIHMDGLKKAARNRFFRSYGWLAFTALGSMPAIFMADFFGLAHQSKLIWIAGVITTLALASRAAAHQSESVYRSTSDAVSERLSNMSLTPSKPISLRGPSATIRVTDFSGDEHSWCLVQNSNMMNAHRIF